MSGEQSFWSRRRSAVAAEQEAELAAVEAEALAAEHAVLEEKTDDDILAELELPNPDDMKMGDDFSAFMSKAVPDRIRRRALRTLWRSNPVLANVDMLVDYGEDFTDAANVIENLQTTYQVGKGMLKHVQEMARQEEEKAKAEALALEQGEDNTDVAEIALVEDDAIADEKHDESVDVTEYEDPTPPEDAVAYVAATPRRMVFRVEEQA
ncbi:MAG: DUF3306 domain-containing protein [Roseovarius sp.]